MIKIRAIAPSGVIDKKKFLFSVSYLEKKLPLKIYFSNSIFQKKRNMAGDDNSRVQDFIDALKSSKSDVLWAIRGGFGAVRALPKIPLKFSFPSQKLLIGFSDITAYQWYCYKFFRMKSVSGAMLQTDFSEPPADEKVLMKTFEFFKRKSVTWEWDKSVKKGPLGIIKAPIIGGCLSVIEKLLGTPYLPNIEGHILFLEDAHEETYRIDGSLSHLQNAGVFQKIKAVILGKFVPPKNSCSKNFFIELEELFDEYFREVGIPTISNFPIGHIKEKWALPIGYLATLTDEKIHFEY